MLRVIFGVLVLAILGGGVWLAASDAAPAQETVHKTLPDTFPR